MRVIGLGHPPRIHLALPRLLQVVPPDEAGLEVIGAPCGPALSTSNLAALEAAAQQERLLHCYHFYQVQVCGLLLLPLCDHYPQRTRACRALVRIGMTPKTGLQSGSLPTLMLTKRSPRQM